MTYSEFRRQLRRTGTSVREFADLLQMNRNSVSNYASSGTVPTHLAVIAALIAEMAEHGVDFRQAFNAVAVEPKKPRGARHNQLMSKAPSRSISG
jgi:transcriptional regulator with XRE-family HTH domain